MPDASFFYQVLKPGRYLGREAGLALNGVPVEGRRVVWYYPGRYADALTDTGWRRGYFQLATTPDIVCLRGIDFARDLWARIANNETAAFTIDRHHALDTADTIVFYVPSPEAAAAIPGIIHKAGLAESSVTIGAVVDGFWAPRFLAGHIDWILPAPGGWLPADLVEGLAQGSRKPVGTCDGRDPQAWDAYWSAVAAPTNLIPTDESTTRRWIPRVDIGDEFADVDLAYVDGEGRLSARGQAHLIADSLTALRESGCDGLRFCRPGEGESDRIVAVLTDLGRIANMRRVRARCPAISPQAYRAYWEGYRPHLIKPALPLSFEPGADTDDLIAIGRSAFNAGWHALTAVLKFDSFTAMEQVVAIAEQVLPEWRRAADSFADKRPIRLEYEPADLAQWQGEPTAPNEDDVRRLASVFRHFREHAGQHAAVGTFRIEDVMGRNWLAAAGPEIWPALAALELSDPNDDEIPPHDWFAWIRQHLGTQGPPRQPFLRNPQACVDVTAASEIESGGATPSVVQPGGHMFGRRKRRPAFTRRLAAPARLRMRVCFAKDENWRLFSHLDLVREIERAIRRAGLPVAYSEGFHPRMKVSFGPPLPFGVISAGEYFDVVLTEDYDAVFAERLGRAFPDGLTLREARGLATNVPSLSDTINEAVFRAVLPVPAESAQGAVDEFLTQKDVRFRRSDRPEKKPFDPRRNLRSMTVEPANDGVEWTIRLRIGGEGSIRPADWLSLVFGLSPSELASVIIERTELSVRATGQTRSPLDSL